MTSTDCPLFSHAPTNNKQQAKIAKNLFIFPIPAEQVKEIIAMNNKGKMPEQLEDYAFIKEQRNTEYGEEGQNVDLSKLE